MAQPDVGPNDIVIHLVNPYKCATCGTEFFLRSMLLEHLGEHIDKEKAANPCCQVVCGVNVADGTENGITVTRDILQINEQQMFELQDPTLDYTQLAPLRALEQAGILNLPPKPLQVKKESSKDLQLFVSDKKNSKVSLLKNSSLSVQKQTSNEKISIEGPLEDQIQPQDSMGVDKSAGEFSILELDPIMQQALFPDGKVKEDYSILVEAPTPLSGDLQAASNDSSQLIMPQGQRNFIEVDLTVSDEKSILGKKKKRSVCSVCHYEFSNQNALKRHQVIHTGVRPYKCVVCFLHFNDMSSLRKHSLIHKRQHCCPICHRLYLRKVELLMHMKQHGKKKFIQFGQSFHEVKVKTSRNEFGQMVQEFSLTMLLKDDEKESDNYPSESNTIDGDENLSAMEIDLRDVENAASEDILNSATSVEGGEQHESVSGIKRKSLIYKCGHCQKIIFTRPTLSRHLIRHTNKRPFPCGQCGKAFRDKTDLVHHIKTHTKPIKCQTCSAAFSKVLYLERHHQKGCPGTEFDTRFTVLDDQRCQCNLCYKILKSKTNIVKHLRVHAFNDRIQGSVSSGSQSHLKITEESKEGSKKDEMSEDIDDYYRALEDCVGFTCLICGLEFRFKSLIRTHIHMHLDIRPFKCHVCSKGFHGKYLLKKHMQNHTRPYKCPVCNKGFIRRYLMKQHFKKKHEGDVVDDMEDITVLEDQKKIQCDICGKQMASFQKSLMKYHVRMHKDVRPFKCEECNKTFSSDNALKKHSLNHKKPYVCIVCSKGFSRRYLLLDHVKKKCGVSAMNVDSDNFQNSYTEAISKREETENQEENENDEPALPYSPKVITQISPTTGKESYVCQPCDKTFILHEALLRHINTFARVTTCKHCGKVFQDKHLCNVHQRSCLGMGALAKRKATTLKKAKPSVGKRQEKVQEIRAQVKKTIDSISSDTNEISGITTEECIVIFPPTSDTKEGNSNIDAVTDVASSHTPSEAQSKKGPIKEAILVVKEKKDSFPCPECSKSFNTARGLKIHANSHLMLFKCEKCDQEFNQLSELRTHTLSHDENNDHVVAIQDTEEHQSVIDEKIDAVITVQIEQIDGNQILFTSGSNDCITAVKKELNDDNEVITDSQVKGLSNVYQRLMQSGSRGRPFSCQMCRRRFTEQSSLDSHMLQIHGMKQL